ncbi:MAG: polysaccharide deacetylase family protein [Firmicutes bacterium]|nr:polysaccharide deacetylase family protein [Bacillota bacterium]
MRERDSKFLKHLDLVLPHSGRLAAAPILLLLILCAVIFPAGTRARILHDEARISSPPIPNVFPPRYHDCVVVLMYHQIGFQHQRRGVIPPELFDAHMLYLKKMGFNPISHDAFANFLDGRGKVPNNAILITFDDGYESFYKYAYPTLEKYRFPAINFVIVGDTGNTSHSINIPHLSWNEMKEMEKSGLVALESHTYDSHYYAPVDRFGHKRPALVAPLYDAGLRRRESTDEYETRVWCDLWLSKHLLEENLHTRVTSLCFPYGAYNSTVIRLARGMGYRYFYTIRSGVNRPGRGAVLVRRISAGDSYVTIPELNRRISCALSPVPSFFDAVTKIKTISARHLLNSRHPLNPTHAIGHIAPSSILPH